MSRRRVGPVSDQAIVDQELAQQLVDRAKAEGVKLTGPGGLLGDLTKRVLEAGLEGETDGHLGYAKHTVEASALCFDPLTRPAADGNDGLSVGSQHSTPSPSCSKTESSPTTNDRSRPGYTEIPTVPRLRVGSSCTRSPSAWRVGDARIGHLPVDRTVVVTLIGTAVPSGWVRCGRGWSAVSSSCTS